MELPAAAAVPTLREVLRARVEALEVPEAGIEAPNGLLLVAEVVVFLHPGVGLGASPVIATAVLVSPRVAGGNGGSPVLAVALVLLSFDVNGHLNSVLIVMLSSVCHPVVSTESKTVDLFALLLTLSPGVGFDLDFDVIVIVRVLFGGVVVPFRTFTTLV